MGTDPHAQQQTMNQYQEQIPFVYLIREPGTPGEREMRHRWNRWVNEEDTGWGETQT